MKILFGGVWALLLTRPAQIISRKGSFFSDKDEDEASSRLVLVVPAFESLERSLDLHCRRLHLRVGQVDVCKVERSADDELS